MRRLLSAALALFATAALLAVAALHAGGARSASLSQLGSELSATQARESSLSASIAALQHEISALTAQIALVQSREATVRAALAADEARLVTVRAAVGRERARLARLRRRLAWAKRLLAAQLVSSYERPAPTLVSVVLDAHGFDQLLQQVAFLNDAKRAQQTTIRFTQTARQAAAAAAARLTALRNHVQLTTDAAATEAAALAGMNALLGSREAALGHAQAAQEAALGAARARGAQLRRAIATVQAQEAAARAAAAAAALRAPESSAGGVALGATDGWAIPDAIVLCESGGQNLPPNSVGASGYYQIIPGTWRLFGGSGPAAYLAPKAEQNAVASRIWDGGAGASNWVCSGIVGIG